MDCVTLMRGMEKVNELIKQITGFSIYHYLTISSLAFQYAKKMGCLDGTCMVSGNLQKFIAKFVIGGRVGLRYNEKQLVNKKIQNFDAVSLYLSSIEVMTVPKGKAVLIKGDNLLVKGRLNPEVFSKYSQYFIACKIQMNKKQQISMISVKDPKTLVREWVNTTSYKNPETFEDEIYGNTVYLDKLSMEDAVEYHDITILQIIQAVGYPIENGINTESNKLARHLHEARNVAKAEKNETLSDMYKLLGNSIYGVSLLGDCPVEIHHKHGNNKYASFVNNNYHRIKHIKQYGVKQDSYRFKCRKNIIGNENFITFGCCVLSQSKRIMNNVMGLANANNIPVFYNDTDSCHMLDEDVEKLSNLYREKFGKELVGNDLGQFHGDFKSSKISNDGLHSVKFIGLGKKCYLHVIENTEGQQDYYARFKGANLFNLEAYCNKNNMNLEQLYESFHKGEEHDINIADGKIRFKFDENGVKTIDTMVKHFGFKK